MPRLKSVQKVISVDVLLQKPEKLNDASSATQGAQVTMNMVGDHGASEVHSEEEKGADPR